MDKKHATIANTSFVESSFAENHQHLETPYASPSKTDHRELQEGSGGGICTHLIDQECLAYKDQPACTYGNNCSTTKRFCIRRRSSDGYKCRNSRSNDHCKNSDYTICEPNASATKTQTPEEIEEAKEAARKEALRIQKIKDEQIRLAEEAAIKEAERKAEEAARKEEERIQKEKEDAADAKKKEVERIQKEEDDAKERIQKLKNIAEKRKIMEDELKAQSILDAKERKEEEKRLSLVEIDLQRQQEILDEEIIERKAEEEEQRINREIDKAAEQAQRIENSAALDSATQAAKSHVNNATQRLEDAIAAINQRKAKVRLEFQRDLSKKKESAHKSYQLEATATLKNNKVIIDDWTFQRDNAKNDLKDADESKKKQTENKKVRQQAEKIKKDLQEKEIKNQVNDNLEKARKEAEKSAALMEDAFLDTDLTASLNEPSYSNTTNNILESDSNESTSYHENAFLRFLFVLGFFAVVVLIYRRFFKSRVSLSHSMTKSPTCHQSETTFSSANTPDDRAANHAIYTIEGDELFSPKQSYLSIISEVPNHYDAIEDSLLSDDRNSVYNTMYEETTEFESNDSNAGLSIISCESSFSKDDSIAQGGGSIKTSMSSIDNIEL